ncbi:MAG: type I-B CRISPR-associated protein Cas7/Csh2 [Moorellales bacterium]
MSLIDRNSEILFLYDAKMCNPNGDPDDENRPRMDPDRERCLVSDVRLKRYLREYLEDKGYTIYVTKSEGVVQATDRLKKVLGREDNPTADDLPELLAKLVDVRLFGATMPIKGARRGEGEAVNLTGPVQFSWGYSLNRVQMVDSVTISSQFATREQAGQGTFGKDYRLYYALIAFHGVISARRAQAMRARTQNDTSATSEADVALLDEALVCAIPLMATRSKIGQYPRLYARFVFRDAETFMGDPREDLSLDVAEGLRSVRDYRLEIGGLAERIGRVKDRLDRVVVWQDPALITTVEGREIGLGEWLAGILGANRVRRWERA